MSVKVTGCYEALSGSVIFTEGSCEYTGCFVQGGIHDGQVEVTINGTCCDEDTYYACLNPVTKKFEVEIPERCCEGVRTCFIGFIDACDESDIIPSNVTLYLSRADRNCVAQFPSGNCKEIQNSAGDISGPHDLVFTSCLDQDDYPAFGSDCRWSGRLANGNEWNVFFPTIATPCEGIKSGTCVGANSLCDPDEADHVLDSAVFAYLGMGGSGLSRQCRLEVNSFIKIASGWQACSTLFAHQVLLSDLGSGDTIFDYFATSKESNTFGATQNNVTGGSAYIVVPSDAKDYSAYPDGEEPC
jgi:hypothetical protein